MKNPFTEEIYTKRKTDRKADIRGDFFRDQTAIIHSTPFRRLKSKTQVFFAPENDHICTRIEHVLHVATIAATICKGLNNEGWELDSDMAYAIGLGHDLGHTPFGHAGESALNTILGGGYSFVHEINSYRQAEFLANNGEGLNLCYGVKDGIICHNGEKDDIFLKPSQTLNDLDNIKDRSVVATSYEGCIMRFSDKIAYLGRDLEDAYVAGFIKDKDVPENVKKELGNKNGQIINNLVIDLIKSSKDSTMIKFSEEKYELVTQLKDFNSKKIYSHPSLRKYDEFCYNIIKNIFDYLAVLYEKNGNDFEKYNQSDMSLDKYFGDYLKRLEGFYSSRNEGKVQIITDYISGMTDFFALESIKQITIPKPIMFT